jgi:hypothetical protein
MITLLLQNAMVAGTCCTTSNAWSYLPTIIALIATGFIFLIDAALLYIMFKLAKKEFKEMSQKNKETVYGIFIFTFFFLIAVAVMIAGLIYLKVI